MKGIILFSIGQEPFNILDRAINEFVQTSKSKRYVKTVTK